MNEYKGIKLDELADAARLGITAAVDELVDRLDTSTAELAEANRHRNQIKRGYDLMKSMVDNARNDIAANRAHEVHRRQLVEDLVRSLWRSRRHWQDRAMAAESALARVERLRATWYYETPLDAGSGIEWPLNELTEALGDGQ